MWRRRSAWCYAAIVALLLASTAGAAEYFTDRGSLWVGSGLGLAVDDGAMVQVQPTFRIFLSPFFAIGPRAHWTGMFDTYSRINQLGVGFEAGFAMGRNTPVVPFAFAGAEWLLSAQSYDYGFGSSGSFADIGIDIPVQGGVMVRLGETLALQIQGQYDFVAVRSNPDNAWNTLNAWTVGIGFAAIGRGRAVSFVDIFPGPF